MDVFLMRDDMMRLYDDCTSQQQQQQQRQTFRVKIRIQTF